MKSFANILILALCWTQTALGGTKAVEQFLLDDRQVYPIAVACNRITTISFPGPISAIDAANVTVDGTTPGLFQIAHTKGSRFFSVRALATNAATDVNVRWNNQTYVLELHESDRPCYSVIFDPPSDRSPNRTPIPVAVTPDRLLAMLDMAKAYRVLKKFRPDAVAGVQHIAYAAKPQIMDYGKYAVEINEAFRFNPQDTLVFRLTLINKTSQPFAYAPDRFSLRVGNRVYPESFSDASGTIPPKMASAAYFEVTGTPDGGRNDISLKNDFIVLLDAFPVSDPATQKNPAQPESIPAKESVLPKAAVPPSPPKPVQPKPLLPPRLKP